MIENIFLEDLKERNVQVTRNSPFVSCNPSLKGPISTICDDLTSGGTKTILSNYVVGCDGAHSKVRKSIPGIEMVGESGKAAWGVLDGVISTDFPDIWSKVAIHSHSAGSILCIPRERNMTRLYIELHPGTIEPLDSEVASQEFVMARAKEIMAPYTLSWESVEWFSVYRVGQRVASSFTSPDQKIFITGDASHTHSPKAAQGMNVSMHDSFNLAWKLALSTRGIAKPTLLHSYEVERRQIAQQLIDFDYEHANAFLKGDSEALTKNFEENIRFISGVGAEYHPNVLCISQAGSPTVNGGLKSGALIPPAKVVRFLDANPIDIQLDIPLLCQFRIYAFTGISSSNPSLPFLTALSTKILDPNSLLTRLTTSLKKSYAATPSPRIPSDEYTQPNRYSTVSPLFTPALVVRGDKNLFEIATLPELWKQSPWTVYIDELEGQSCVEKFAGVLGDGETVLAVVRPDGYVGAVGRWQVGEAEMAASWLDGYFAGFLEA
jgi:phenol 2-monooxygenase